MPASNATVYFSRQDSTYGTGSKLVTSSGSQVSGTVALSLPGTALGTSCYSAPVPTRSGATMPTTVYATSSYDIYEVPPNGTGWFLEDGGLDGNRPWYDTVATTGALNFASWSGSYSAWAYLRFWSYRPSAGQYTWLGAIYDNTTTFRQNNDAAWNQVTFNTAFANAKLDPDCVLYVDLVWYFSSGSATARTVNMTTGDGVSKLGVRIIPQAEAGPVHDNLANAYVIGTGYTGAVSPGSNAYATYESGETRNAVYDTGWSGANCDAPGSVWFKWTCPSDGSQPEVFKIELGPQRSGYYVAPSSEPYGGQGVSIATRLRVYTSSTPSAPTFPSLTLIANVTKSGGENYQASPDWWSEYQINAPVPGQTYFFQVMTQNQVAPSTLTMANVDAYYSLTVTSPRVTWRQLWRGPWVSRPEVTYTRADLSALNSSSSWNDLPDGNSNFEFQGIFNFHGGWSWWQFAPYPDPCKYPEAYEIASFHAHLGDQSADESNNARDATWALDAQYTYSPYWVPGSFRFERLNPDHHLGTVSQGAGLGTGAGGGSTPASSGGHTSAWPQGPMVGGMLETYTYWSFEIFSPKKAAYHHNTWTYLGKLPGSTDTSGLPAGTYGIAYSKENCDVVSFKVRPSTAGFSDHPGNGLFAQTINGRWYWQKNEYPLAPPKVVTGDQAGWGANFRNNQWGQKVLACRTRCFAGEYPELLPGNLATQLDTVLVGQVSYTGGVQVSRDTGWTQVVSYQAYDRATDPNPDYDDYFFFGFLADWVEANDPIGNQIGTAQQGTSSWSFSRRISGQNLEFELVLQPPCYALLYDSPQYPTNTCPGMTLPPPPTGVVPDITGAYNQERIRFWRNDPRSS